MASIKKTAHGLNLWAGTDRPQRTDFCNDNELVEKLITALEAAAPKPGDIILRAGETVPEGWLLCNGAAVSRTEYASLFKAIGTLWGAGNGSTTFNLPDFRGRFPQGHENNLGTSGGIKDIVLKRTNLPSGRYYVQVNESLTKATTTNNSGTNVAIAFHHSSDSKQNISTDLGGQNEAISNIPPYAALAFIIKT